MHKTIYRGVDGGPGEKGIRAEGTSNAIGYFIQNGLGATVAGPFEDRYEAWREEDRLNAIVTAP